MKPGRAFFFDLDDTLLDGSRYRDAIVRTCEAMAAESRVPAARLLEANGEIWPDYSRQVMEKWELGVLSGASLHLGAWRLTLQACGCRDEAIAQLASETHSRLYRETYRLFDDVQAVIASLKDVRVPLALITNGASDSQRDKIRVLGIEQWFDAIVIVGEVGAAKPDPSGFRIALDKLAAEREDVWHVGDSLTTDVAGAKAAGITAVWLNRRGLVRKESDPEPDSEICSLSSLVPYFSR